MTDTRLKFNDCIRKALKPLIKMLLRNQFTYQEFASLSRSVFVEVANTEREFAEGGRKQTANRISLLTGLNRKDVAKLLSASKGDVELTKVHRAERVIDGWRNGTEFQNGDGSPARLTIGKGADGPFSFEQLVKKHSGDVSARTVQYELTGSGAAEVSDNEEFIALTGNPYIPVQNNMESLRLGSNNLRDHINTVAHNVNGANETGSEPFLERKVEGFDIPYSVAVEFQEMCEKKIDTLLQELDIFLDERKNEAGDIRCRTGIGVYYFEGKHDV